MSQKFRASPVKISVAKKGSKSSHKNAPRKPPPANSKLRSGSLSGPPKAPSSLEKLDKTILAKIFAFITNLRQLFKLRRVCKTFKDVIERQLSTRPIRINQKFFFCPHEVINVEEEGVPFLYIRPGVSLPKINFPLIFEKCLKIVEFDSLVLRYRSEPFIISEAKILRGLKWCKFLVLSEIDFTTPRGHTARATRDKPVVVSFLKNFETLEEIRFEETKICSEVLKPLPPTIRKISLVETPICFPDFNAFMRRQGSRIERFNMSLVNLDPNLVRRVAKSVAIYCRNVVALRFAMPPGTILDPLPAFNFLESLKIFGVVLDPFFYRLTLAANPQLKYLEFVSHGTVESLIRNFFEADTIKRIKRIFLKGYYCNIEFNDEDDADNEDSIKIISSTGNLSSEN